ncbi:MAG: iron ABC transporter permease [Lachnospiraceae bacterium]|nr:iron ABC transporter permease [Lachnospiraceae bacterium]
MNKKKITTIVRYQIAFILLLGLIAVGIVLNVNTGSVSISPLRVFQIIFLRADAGSMESNIIWKIRLPRLLTAAVLGGALSVSGFLLQTFFRNPIAGPFVLGISSGAKMCVGFVMIFVVGSYSGMPPYLMVMAAFVGSLLIMGCVLLFSQKARNMSMLLVIGIMIGYICSAVTDFCIAFAKDSEIASLTSWSMGSFSGSSWNSFGLICIIVFGTLILSMLLSKPMDAYQLGEGYAKSMGLHIRLFRIALIVLSSLLSACVTAFAGPISFVGIAVPQVAKMMMKTAKPIVIIPAAFLSGAVFCLFCDLIARTAFSPTELSVGTVTSIFGAPVVISLMLKQRKKQG